MMKKSYLTDRDISAFLIRQPLAQLAFQFYMPGVDGCFFVENFIAFKLKCEVLSNFFGLEYQKVNK